MDTTGKLNKVAREIVELLVAKNEEYGDANLEAFGLLGIVTRINDKIARILTAISKDHKPSSPIIVEALKDIAGYAINALRLIEEDRLAPFGSVGKVIFTNKEARK